MQPQRLINPIAGMASPWVTSDKNRHCRPTRRDPGAARLVSIIYAPDLRRCRDKEISSILCCRIFRMHPIGASLSSLDFIWTITLDFCCASPTGSCSAARWASLSVKSAHFPLKSWANMLCRDSIGPLWFHALPTGQNTWPCLLSCYQSFVFLGGVERLSPSRQV